MVSQTYRNSREVTLSKNAQGSHRCPSPHTSRISKQTSEIHEYTHTRISQRESFRDLLGPKVHLLHTNLRFVGPIFPLLHKDIRLHCKDPTYSESPSHSSRWRQPGTRVRRQSSALSQGGTGCLITFSQLDCVAEERGQIAVPER